MIQLIKSRDVAKFINSQISKEVEEFWCIGMSAEKFVLASELLFRGTVDGCLVHPRDIFRFACRVNASALILVHNHPTGRTLPSDEDRAVTKRLVEISRIMEIPILDHIIVSRNLHYSFCDAGLIFQAGRNSFYEAFSDLR